MGKHQVTMFCGYQCTGHSPAQRFCNRKCSGFFVSRRPGAKKNKRSSAGNPARAVGAKFFISNFDPVWIEQGKRHVTKSGYVDLYFWSRELKLQFSRREHIVIWSMVNREELPSGWCVHHLDGDRSNNEPENLLGLPKGMHQELHRRLEIIDRKYVGLEKMVKRHEVHKEFSGRVKEMEERAARWYVE